VGLKKVSIYVLHSAANTFAKKEEGKKTRVGNFKTKGMKAD